MMILTLLLLQWSPQAHAVPTPKYPTSVSVKSVKEFLKNSSQVEELKQLGPKAYKHLREIMLSEDSAMDERWNATLAMARIGGSESQPDIDLALNHQQWYLRSAGLLATSIAQADHGVEKAKNFLKTDPALLVRATALQVLAQQKNVDREFLWAQMYNPINFDKGQSLSLRLSLLKVLSKDILKSENAKFVALVRESHAEIRDFAKEVLHKNSYLSKNSSLEEM